MLTHIYYRAARTGIKLAEIFNAEVFERKLRQLHSGFLKRYGDLLKYDIEDELKRFEGYREELAKYTVDAVALMKDAQDKNTDILIEGANALMLDIDYGTVSQSKAPLLALQCCSLTLELQYPYVTSSNCGLYGPFCDNSNSLGLSLKGL